MASELFEKLSEEKRLIVINAAISCFAKSGYKKTPISEIAEAAGISKASIFQYFGTKKDLCVFLYGYISDAIMAEITEGTDDLFECLTLYNKMSMQLSKKHPGMFELMQMNVQGLGFDDDEMQDFIELEQRKCDESVSVLFENVDWNRLQDAYDRDTVLRMATWIKSGCLTQLAPNTPEEEVYAELERYLVIVKKAVYKPEYL